MRTASAFKVHCRFAAALDKSATPEELRLLANDSARCGPGKNATLSVLSPMDNKIGDQGTQALAAALE